MRSYKKLLSISLFVSLFFLIGISTTHAAVDACATDLNSDGVTNVNDYSILVSSFLNLHANAKADINADGSINIIDYSIMVNNFFKSCTNHPSATPPPATPPPTVAPTAPPTAAPTAPPTTPPSTSSYPMHTNITATVFWAGEPKGNGSSEDNALTAYDDAWLAHYGGFDEYRVRRTAANNYFPTDFYPKENPFYLDLPYDDLNNSNNFKNRTNVIPWAKGQNDPGKSYSFMKNRWVRLEKGGKVCYGQNEDAGPYVYNDTNYVFGSNDARPVSTRANNAGMDVSPALRDCLGFQDLNGDSDKINWQFVEASDVPNGPWKIVVTTSQVYQP